MAAERDLYFHLNELIEAAKVLGYNEGEETNNPHLLQYIAKLRKELDDAQQTVVDYVDKLSLAYAKQSEKIVSNGIDTGLEIAILASRGAQPHWIKSWDKIDPDKSYIVMAVGARRIDNEVYFYGAKIYDGWQVKRLFEGAYVATECHTPTSLEDCL